LEVSVSLTNPSSDEDKKIALSLKRDQDKVMQDAPLPKGATGDLSMGYPYLVPADNFGDVLSDDGNEFRKPVSVAILNPESILNLES